MKTEINTKPYHILKLIDRSCYEGQDTAGKGYYALKITRRGGENYIIPKEHFNKAKQAILKHKPAEGLYEALSAISCSPHEDEVWEEIELPEIKNISEVFSGVKINNIKMH